MLLSVVSSQAFSFGLSASKTNLFIFYVWSCMIMLFVFWGKKNTRCLNCVAVNDGLVFMQEAKREWVALKLQYLSSF